MICSPISEAMESSRHFCEYMGFKVMSPAEQLANTNNKDEILASIYDDETNAQKMMVP